MNRAQNLTLQEAADLVGFSRSRLWRAMTDGRLDCEQTKIGGRSIHIVPVAALWLWIETWLTGDERLQAIRALGQAGHVRDENGPVLQGTDSVRSPENSVRSPENENEPVEAEFCSLPDEERPDEDGTPPVEFWRELVDSLRSAEARAVRAEAILEERDRQIYQNQRLLSERAQSEEERKAEAARANDSLARSEADRKTLVSANEYLATQNEDLKVQLDLVRAKLAEEASLSMWARFRRKFAPGASQTKAG